MKELIINVVDEIENIFLLEDEELIEKYEESNYKKRIEGFYYKFDTKNCERVYQEILNLDKEV